MPILIEQSNFTDVYGNITPYYISDSGDKIIAEFSIRSIIRMSSIGNPLTLDPTVNQVVSPTSWIEEGFRVNQWLWVRIHSSGGSVLPGPNGQFWTLVNYVDDVMIDLNGIPSWYNIQNNESVSMIAVTGFQSTIPIRRDDMEVQINHIKNSLPNGAPSLIDGETTRSQLNGLAVLPVASSIVGTFVGNQSGQFVYETEITHDPIGVDGWTRHTLKITLAQSGIYNTSWFTGAECLKLYIRILWAVVSGEPFARSECIYNKEANTGRYNEAFNSAIINGIMIQGLSTLDYCVPTTADIIVDGEIIGIGMGACYFPTDTAYYKNKPESQINLTMLLPTDIINNFFGTISSALNPDGAGFDITLDNLVQIGSITTATITFTPNAQFTTFMENRDDGDRLFYLWLRCGNLNLLAFADQLECAPPVGGPLPMITDYGYLDHSENIDTIDGILTGFEVDTEDDIAYTGTFLLTKGEIYDNFSVKIEAFNTVSEDDFTLQVATFSFAGVQISGDGRYLLNESQTIVTTLPNTSLKSIARLTLEPLLDTPTEYGVRIYYPFLCRWEYWLTLNGVSVDFYPNQNKNWEQYDNIGDWIMRTELQLIKDGLAYVHDNQVIIHPYNNEDNIDSTIELFIESSNLLVNIVPENEIMKIKATHINLLGAWDVNTWGMITIEPFESSARSICSTVVPFDNNTSNPLTSYSGNVIPIQYPLPNIAIMECRFDSSLIDLSNGVKITAKIKDRFDIIPPYVYPITAQKDALIAYSTKYKLSPLSVYSGAIMRVRRGIDNAELDIPFLNNSMDEGALLAFTGNGIDDRAWIVKLYDQSGFNNHAISPTFAEQPEIVVGGVILTSVNGFASGNANGIANKFTLTNPIEQPAEFTYYHVLDRTSGNNFLGLGTTNTNPMPMAWTIADRIIDLVGTVANIHSIDTDTGNFLFTSNRTLPAFNVNIRKNGDFSPTLFPVPPIVGQFLDQLLERTIPQTNHKGAFQEFIYFGYDRGAQIPVDEANIKFRYNIP